MTRMLGMILALALAAALVPQGSAPAEAAKKKAKHSGANQQGQVQFQDYIFTGNDKGTHQKRRRRLIGR